MDDTVSSNKNHTSPSANSESVLVGSVVDSTRNLPDGDLLSRKPDGEFSLPDAWCRTFAVMRCGNRHYLIVAETEFGSSRMFEVRRRMKEAGLTDIHLIKATDDVIKLKYAEHETRVAGIAGEVQKTNIETLAAEIIAAGIERGASDIHIEARGSRANVFFRINGTRIFFRDLSYDTARSIGTVLYTVHADAGSKETSWDPGSVQDGVLEWVMNGGTNYQLRFSSSPIYPSGGFHIVVRLLSMEATGRGLDTLGYTAEQLAALDVMTLGSNGIALICGPMNSGKSTSLQALMHRLYLRRGDTIKMITVEDPVEYVIEGACQISVPRTRDVAAAFTAFLRGTLRQDADVVMVGEIRDTDSALVVKDLALTGRKILATLHTYSALWVFVRLREIGVPWEILTMPDFIAGIVCQRLVPVLCPDCSIPIKDKRGLERIPKDTLHRIQQVASLAEDDIRVRGDGCAKCMHTGVIDQTVCAEFVLPDRVLLRHLSHGEFIAAEKYWRDSGVGVGGGDGQHGVTALSHALSKMRKGLLSPIDVEERVALLTSDLVNSDSMISRADHSLLAESGIAAIPHS